MIPWLSVAIAGLCVWLPFSGLPFEGLALTRSGVEQGELWRLWTGHLVHGGPSHLFWDVAAFAALGWQAERRLGARALAALLAFAAAAVSVGTLALAPGLDWYCGISGLDTALFAWLVASDARRTPLERSLWAAALAAKLAYEFSTGSMLFAHAAGLPPAPHAHLLGAAAGLMSAVSTRRGAPAASPLRVERAPLCSARHV